jgi:hypothetical protein
VLAATLGGTRWPGRRARLQPRTRRRRLAFLLLALLGAVAAACGASSGSNGDADEPAGAGERPVEARDPESVGLLLAGYPVYDDPASGLRVIFGTPDLGVGTHRVAFALTNPAEGLVRLPIVRAASYYYPRGASGPREGPVEQATARFFEFPFGTRGIYSTELALDRPGDWGLELTLPQADGGTRTTTFLFPVAQRTSAPAVGDPAPASASRTLDDAGSLAELTTSYEPDPALYGLSIADAIAEARPFVVVFASPAFCTNALCGPQVEVLSDLAARHGERANFLHVDLYENPHEIQGDLDRAVRTPVLEEWGIHTDEWTFVVDAEGRVAGRFEAFVTEKELEQTLLSVLDADRARAAPR